MNDNTVPVTLSAPSKKMVGALNRKNLRRAFDNSHAPQALTFKVERQYDAPPGLRFVTIEDMPGATLSVVGDNGVPVATVTIDDDGHKAVVS